MKTETTTAQNLDELPGYYIRRLHQIAVAIFLQETEAHGPHTGAVRGTEQGWPDAGC